jgi:hypothetical protein
MLVFTYDYMKRGRGIIKDSFLVTRASNICGIYSNLGIGL